MSNEISSKFGACCEDLRDALEVDEDTIPLIAEDDGVLVMSVALLGGDDGDGKISTENNEISTYDAAIFFCPFCGTKLQNREEITAKIAAKIADESR